MAVREARNKSGCQTVPPPRPRRSSLPVLLPGHHAVDQLLERRQLPLVYEVELLRQRQGKGALMG